MTPRPPSRRQLCSGLGHAALGLCLGPGLAKARAATPGPRALRLPDARFVEPLALAPYYPAVLRLALERSAGGDAPPALEEVGDPSLVKERYRRLLAVGELDLLWSSSTPEREAEFLPVRFNLLKGVNEHRVLVVRRRDLPRFAALNGLEDLRALKAGAGVHWSDAQILRANRFEVVTASRHHSLFQMLARGRFDFLALSVAEVDDALLAHDDPDLAVEPTLLLRYPQPIYFFVNRQRPELAERLLRGLQAAAADGSLDRLFFAQPSLKQGWARISAGRRRLLTLEGLKR